MLGSFTASHEAAIKIPAYSFSRALMGHLEVQDPREKTVITQSKYDGAGLVGSLHKYHTANINELVLIAGIIGLLLVFSLSVFSFQRTGVWVVRLVTGNHQPISTSYSDQDGVAAPKAPRKTAPWPLRLIILVIVVAGTVVSSVQACQFTRNTSSLARYGWWNRVGIWICKLLQSTALAISSSATASFAISWRAGVSTTLMLLVLLAQVYGTLLSDNSNTILLVLAGSEAILGTIAGALCFMIPRRPDVFYKGIIVDRQFTTSLLGWISFSWAETVLQMAERPPSLNVKDLPELDNYTRGETTYAAWKSNLRQHEPNSATNLWWTILRSHRASICAQVTITCLQSIFAFVPQLAMLRILIILEGSSGENGRESLLFAVIGLGLSVMASATLETFKYWISYNKLVIRVRQQLSLSIFEKAVRLNCFSDPSPSGTVKSADETYSPVNLVAVDVQNVVDFLCFSFLLYESPLKLGLALTFLVRLLGWQSVLVGISVLLLLTLLNILAGRKYARLQGILMRFRDRRVRAISEMLQGIHQIKFSAHESRWQHKINQLRDTEMRAQRIVCLWQIVFVSMSLISPIMLSATCLSVFVLLSGRLSAATAFTSVSVLASIEVAMTILPDVLSLLLNARVSMERIQTYLTQSERENKTIPAKEINFDNVTVAWPGCGEGRGILRGLDLRFPKGALSIVTGPTGSGKSLLLAAILGEVDVLEGRIMAPRADDFEELSQCPEVGHWLTDSALAFVSQTPWLQNTTVKDNILFGLPFDEARYRNVIFACALYEDFASLPQGDQTAINSKGSNLSGGQKWRVSLARALFSRARTLLMDDIFSALDVHTREHVYRHVLCGTLLHDRTCILVTHHLELCKPHAQYVVYLKKGALQSATTVSQVSRVQEVGDKRDAFLQADESPSNAVENKWRSTNISTGRIPSITSSGAGKEKEMISSFPPSQGAASIFLKEGANSIEWLFLGVAFLTYGGFMLSRAWWIHLWTDHYKEATDINIFVSDHQYPVYYWLGIYLSLSVLTCIVGTCRTYLSLSAALRASQSLFRKMLSATLQAPLQWHEKVPLGDILSRFTADISVLDMRVGDDLRATLEYTMDVILAIVAGAIVNPFLLGISALLLALYFWCARRFVTASRKLKVLENASKGPPLEYIDNIFNGLSTVRAFGQENIVMQQFCTRVGHHARAYWHLWLLNRWLGFRINVLGAIFSAVSAAMVVYTPGVSPSTAGFAITFTIEVSLVMALSIRRYVNLEQGLNSVARIHSYATVPREDNPDPTVHSDNLESWPQRGKLQVSDLCVRHAPHLPLVLQGVSFTANPGSRVGVIGRTGAGKSSLVLALFRFIKATQGKIVVDGVDISQVPLHSLRSRLAIIPQHPVLFRGIVRSNLDPFHEYEDDTLLSALQAVGWQEVNFGISRLSEDVSTPPESSSSLPNSADTCLATEESSSDAEEATPFLKETLKNNILSQPVTDCGENLSHGQRQLLCLARVIVRQPKIMILDEATASVDKATDQLIQRSLRSALGNRQTTLLVIAHRLKTVADSDVVLVLDSGRIVESGSPLELLQREDGYFRGMIEQDPDREALKESILGETSQKI
ncbi:uncharacterized protein KD926_004710 [Aspergillus affinis]|uniref:uncharacterized protein n=1 Tax=Aspergillus affinis TaxID=1070780 RepID=UPI0022FDE8D2|nr:uncharacterized protein KD926_004710 [Aspergillus affinis]KAI9042920.1 hypothetical protein KD926_004710 [Aspergillus affinis]